MKDLITLLIVGVVLVLKVRSAFKESPAQAEPETSDPLDMEGEKPYWEVEEEMEEAPKESKMEQILTMLGQPRKPQPKPAPVAPATVSKPMPVTKTLSQPTPRKKESINGQLHSANGARRAFIYSEIFKRKYN